MSRLTVDGAVSRGLGAVALLSAAIAVLIILFLAVESAPALRSIGVRRFATDPGWHPSGDPAAGEFGLAPMLVGTLASTAGAVLLAGPLGVLSAVFCRVYAPRRVASWYRRMIGLLAGIPSVVYGLWGLVTLAPIIRHVRPPGTSLLTGILVLAVMILPTIALLADAALRNVPRSYLHASAALALSRWTTVRRVLLPASRSGLAVAVVLGTARAIGETMAVLMVCGNVVRMPASVFDPVRTLTANVALELGYAYGAHRSALFVSGLLLMSLVVILVLGAALLNREPARG